MSDYFLWFLIGVVFLIVEGLVPAFFAIFFAAAAWILSLYTAFYDPTLDNQLIIFSLLSMISVLFFRRYLNPYSNSSSQFDDKDQILSGKGNVISLKFEENPQYAIVSKEINLNEFGEIKFKGTFYKAKSTEKISKNTSVRVINQGDSQGTYFIVEPD